MTGLMGFCAAGRPLAERFWANVLMGEPDDCWLWTASVNRSGYGSITDADGKRAVHRVALVLAGVDVPDGSFVHHTCQVRRCVNPRHLEVVASHKEHSLRHVRPCLKHGEAGMQVVRKGKQKGRRYCGVCARERAEHRRVTRDWGAMVFVAQLRTGWILRCPCGAEVRTAWGHATRHLRSCPHGGGDPRLDALLEEEAA